MRKEIIDTIMKNKIIVIVRGVEHDKLLPLAEALYAGGVRALEITYTHEDRRLDEKTADGIRSLSKHFQNKMLIGAGTVTEVSQVELTKKAGGKFIISPDTNEAIIRKTSELDMVSIPGALTPTEIETAYKSGADFVKLFPIISLGADYVKAIKAPLSGIRLLGVGGISENNMSEYSKAGICGFGIGSNLVNKQFISGGNFKAITDLTKKFISNLGE